MINFLCYTQNLTNIKYKALQQEWIILIKKNLNKKIFDNEVYLLAADEGKRRHPLTKNFNKDVLKLRYKAYSLLQKSEADEDEISVRRGGNGRSK